MCAAISHASKDVWKDLSSRTMSPDAGDFEHFVYVVVVDLYLAVLLQEVTFTVRCSPGEVVVDTALVYVIVAVFAEHLMIIFFDIIVNFALFKDHHPRTKSPRLYQCAASCDRELTDWQPGTYFEKKENVLIDRRPKYNRRNPLAT